MTIQSSVQMGDVIRNAVVFNVKNWRGGLMNSDSLIQSVQDLFAVLERRKIDYVLVGGIAILYDIEGRNTQDLDLLMAVSSLEKLPELKITTQDSYFPVQAMANCKLIFSSRKIHSSKKSITSIQRFKNSLTEISH